LSATCFEPRRFILRKTAVHALFCSIVFYMHLCEHSAHTDACKTYHTAYTTVSLRMNLRCSKYIADNRN